MRKTTKFAILLFAVSLALTIGWLVFDPDPPKPAYQGRPVNYWLEELNFSTGDVRRAEEAFGFMGSNAVPFLVATLDKTNGPLKRIYLRCYPKLVEILGNKLPRPVSADELRGYAIAALGTIGPSAKPAIPSLLNLLANDSNSLRRCNAVMVLNAIDNGRYQQEVIDALVRARRDPDPQVAQAATWVLSRLFPFGVPEFYETVPRQSGGGAEFRRSCATPLTKAQQVLNDVA